jgi:hypothetical protein
LVTFGNLDPASRYTLEDKIWDCHVIVKIKLAAAIQKQCASKEAKPVELRKVKKLFLEFIKSSQRHYRDYIGKLAEHAQGIPELEAVSRRVHITPRHFSDILVESQTSQGSNKKAVLRSCHATLVRLGDLSRYRETELVKNDREWGPAIGYYDLARKICPEIGSPYNQLAVIARADSRHLSVVYYLYRAIVVDEPHPNGKKNLEREFRRILAQWKKGNKGERPSGPEAAMKFWFLCLHAKCYQGVEFEERDELENEVLGQLAVAVKEKPMDAILHKITLINIAAQRLAANETRARQLFLQFNARTFFTLMQILQPELAGAGKKSIDSLQDQEMDASERLTSVARRVLPGLRQYTSWLSWLLESLVADSDDLLGTHVEKLFKMFANTLNLIQATFPMDELPAIDYLLEEDEDVIGFCPKIEASLKSRFYLA